MAKKAKTSTQAKWSKVCDKKAASDVQDEEEEELEDDILYHKKTPAGQSEAVLGGTGDGEVSVPVDTFVKLLKRKDKKVSHPPAEYIVNAAKYSGTAEKDMCALSATFEIVILNEGWTKVPLLSDSLSVRSIQVEYPEDNKTTTEGEAAAQLEPSEPTATPGQPAPASQTPLKGFVGVQGGYYCLCTPFSGLFNVTMTADVAFASERHSGANFAVPIATSNEVEWTVHQAGIDLKVETALSCVKTTAESSTTVKCTIPPTRSVNVQWTETSPQMAEEEVPKVIETVVNCSQNNVFSVGEAVLSGTIVLEYSFVSGSRALFEIDVDSDMKILHVEGHALKRWEVVNGPASGAGVSEQSEEGRAAARATKTIRVVLNYAVENSYSLKVVCEREMASTSDIVSLPRLATRGVTREKGFLGIEARTNVEISETSSHGLTRVDISELPITLTKAANNPILFAYKYLTPNYSVTFDVRKHEDAEVLVATVDEGFLRLTVTDDGRTLFRCRLKVRNTQRQYLRVRFPRGSTLWSAYVNGGPVKPAVDASSAEDLPVYMIPLEKSGSGGSQFPVVLVGVFEQPVDGAVEMETKTVATTGTIRLALPVFDLPVNHLLLEVYLPKGNKYGEFSGDLEEVKYFTRTFEADVEDSPGVLEDNRRVRRAAMPQVQISMNAPVLESQMMMSNLANEMPMAQMSYEDRDEEGGLSSMRKFKGILPVRVEVPRVGKLFMFEKLLVLQEGLSLEVRYRKQYKSWLSRRSIFWTPQRMLILTSVVVAAYAVWRRYV